jgi:hypothetical protein
MLGKGFNVAITDEPGTKMLSSRLEEKFSQLKIPRGKTGEISREGEQMRVAIAVIQFPSKK